MPYRTAYWIGGFGIPYWLYQHSTYCVNNTSASDYGKCYNTFFKAVFVQTDTTTYPTLPCESDGTCTRYTSTTSNRELATVADFSSVNKQLILMEFRSLTHTALDASENEYTAGFIVVSPKDNLYMPTPSQFDHLFPLISYNADSNTRYGPYHKIQLNRYTPPPYTRYVVDFWFYPRVFLQKIVVGVFESFSNNIWYAGYAKILYTYEASPLAIIPLDYSEYISHADIRSAFGYSANGFDQPGWNSDDIMRALKEVFPDRTWAVFDDRTYTLYLYGLTMDDAINLGFIAALSPTSVKVLDQNKKGDYTRFKEFYTQKLGG